MNISDDEIGKKKPYEQMTMSQPESPRILKDDNSMKKIKLKKRKGKSINKNSSQKHLNMST